MPPVTTIELRQAGHAVVAPHRLLERPHVVGLRPEVRHQGVTQGNELREIDAHILVVLENLPQDEHITRDGEFRDDDTHR